MVTDVGRRIHAAQAYGGFTSIPALAAKINRAGFGEGTIRRIVAGSRPLEDHECQWLEDATGVPAEFFQVGFAVKQDDGNGDLRALVQRVSEQIDSLSRQADENLNQAVDYRTETQGKLLALIELQNARLAQIDRRLDQLTPLDGTTVVPLVRRALAVVAGEPPEDATQPEGRPRPRRGIGRGTNPQGEELDPDGRPR